MQEIWKDIPGYEGLYRASNLGNIYSVKRNIILKQCVSEKGYLKVCLYINGKPKVKRVNRLIALTFIENPNNLQEVNHKDGDKSNNRVENLEWCTRLYNMQEAFKNNLIPPRKPNISSYPSKVVYQYDLAGNLLNIFTTLASASKITGISKQNISRYCKGQRVCKNFIWKYADK